ncbi:MAG: hypothetical protein JSU05_07410 [Bacteroidetes bacterium]|nr:hypothetical protein [Bacteroidota bacterium]
MKSNLQATPKLFAQLLKTAVKPSSEQSNIYIKVALGKVKTPGSSCKTDAYVEKKKHSPLPHTDTVENIETLGKEWYNNYE